MKLKKIALVTSIVLLLLIVCGYLLIRNWSSTPYGQLDARVAILLQYIEIAGIDLFEEGRSPEEIRKFSSNSSKILRAAPVKLEQIDDITIPGPDGNIPVRIYTPKGDFPLPILVYYHGGGWVIGDLDSHDGICRKLADKAKIIVVAVDYRLAPEHAFPAAFEDAYAAAVWTSQNAQSINGDASRLFVAGDSAGGNLAATVALASRDRGEPVIKGQVLIYPATNLAEFNTESHKSFANGFYLTNRYMKKFRGFYLPISTDRLNPYASPILAESLENLPPAFVIIAQFDVLRDEGQAYAKRLQQAGVMASHYRFDGMIHGFLNMDRVLPQADDAIDRISQFIADLP